MTTLQLIIVRLYMITLGRMQFFAKLLRNTLVKFLITRRKSGRYNASSRFFTINELD